MRPVPWRRWRPLSFSPQHPTGRFPDSLLRLQLIGLTQQSTSRTDAAELAWSLDPLPRVLRPGGPGRTAPGLETAWTQRTFYPFSRPPQPGPPGAGLHAPGACCGWLRPGGRLGAGALGGRRGPVLSAVGRTAWTPRAAVQSLRARIQRLLHADPDGQRRPGRLSPS